MNLKKVFIILSFLTAGSNALAVSDACSLLDQPIPSGLEMSGDEIKLYKERLSAECKWTEAYREINTELSKYNLTLEQIAEYQALRYIRRVDFEEAKTAEIPVELTYQLLASQKDLPLAERSSVVWDNWSRGISQLTTARQQILNGEYFDFEKLKKIHMGFYELSDEIGDFGSAPDKGLIRLPKEEDDYWWALSSKEEAEEALAKVNIINEHYRNLNLLPHFSDEQLNLVLDVRMTVKRQRAEKANVIEYVYAIYSGHSKANLANVQNLMNFMRAILTQALQNKALIWNGKLMTPAETALLAQKFYIGVHPFAEGNGRTGRLIQELILTTMNMPHGSSGDLMDDDVLMTFPEYYSLAMTSNLKLMESMKNCLKIYEQNSPEKLANSDQKNIDYSCRILK